MTYVYTDFGLDKYGSQFALLDELLTVWGFPSNRLTDTPMERIKRWQRSIGNTADGILGPKQWTRLQAGPPAPALVRIDRTNWKITNPDATEVLQPEFETYHNEPWFWEDPDGIQVFRAPTSGGQTTSDATKYLRSETREMVNGGHDKAAWSSEAPHIFKGELAFWALPHVKDHAVGFQIHSGATKIIMGRLEGTKLFIESPFHDDVILNSNYQLKTFFGVEIVPSKEGIKIIYNGGDKVALLDDVIGEGWFYKYGCYTQAYAGQSWNGQIVPKDSYAEVRYRAAAVRAA